MLKSLYSYKGSHARTLSFTPGMKFLEVGPSRDSNWVHVISEGGTIGYVPKNYVAEAQSIPLEMLEIIDGCLDAIHMTASERGGTYSRSEHEALQRLIDLRQEWYSQVSPSAHPNKRPAPPPPNRATSQLSVDSTCSGGSSLPSPSQPTVSPKETPSVAPIESSLSLHSTIDRPSSLISSSTKIHNSNNPISTSFILSAKCQETIKDDNESRTSDTEPKSISIECPSNFKNICDLPSNYMYLLVDDIRSQTNISFSTSQKVVDIVLKSLGSHIPSLEPLFSSILAEKVMSPTSLAQDDLSMSLSAWQHSGDGRKLVSILEKLRECKDDEQQRSWALFEDEDIISAQLEELLDILTNGDLEVCCSVLCLEDYRPLLNLVQYYQMETRWPLRKILLKVFGAICQMTAKNISFLSSSILPVELSRELLDPSHGIEKLQYTALVLQMVLSMGDILPYTSFSIMNESFIEVLLEGIESYSEKPETDQLAELYLGLLLAFNLQYYTQHIEMRKEILKKNETSDNLIIKCLCSREHTKYFTEKLLLLFNREEDPVALFDHKPRPAHSVMVMMNDVYSCSITALYFYTNDEKVTCDIIIRMLTDLPAEDKRRLEYIYLTEGVVCNGRWREHSHRREELINRLKSIHSDEDTQTTQEKLIVSRLFKNYPHFFKAS